MKDSPATLFNPGRQHVPPGTGTVGMVLFLLALVMLFGSSILGYLLIRYNSPDAPAAGSIHLPWPLWISTVVIILSSVTIHWSHHALRIERQREFRRWLWVTLGLALLFLLVQTPSLIALVSEHWPQVQAYREALENARASGRAQAGIPMPIAGLVFFLILVHALHVIGGLVPLGVVVYKASRNAYDHEHHRPVKYIAMYWHFLDAVWVVMFAILLLAS